MLRRGNAPRVSVPGHRSLGLPARPLKFVVAAEGSDTAAATVVESAPAVPKPSPLLSTCTETIPDTEVSITKVGVEETGVRELSAMSTNCLKMTFPKEISAFSMDRSIFAGGEYGKDLT